MPRVNSLDPTKRVVQKLLRLIKSEMGYQNVTQKEMAYELGLSSQAALSHKFTTETFSIVEIVKMLSVLGITLKDLEEIGIR